jgi:hypothetical protein
MWVGWLIGVSYDRLQRETSVQAVDLALLKELPGEPVDPVAAFDPRALLDLADGG